MFDLPLAADLPGHEPIIPRIVRHLSDADTPLYNRPSVQSSHYDSQQRLHDPLSKQSAIPSVSPVVHVRNGIALRLVQKTYLDIIDVLTTRPPEFAAMLMGPKGDNTLVTHAVWDDEGESTSTTFTLNARFLNRKLKLFKAVDMDCKGFCHSHPQFATRLSHGDITYVRDLFSKPKNDASGFVYMPIVCDGQFYAYAVDRRGEIVLSDLVLV